MIHWLLGAAAAAAGVCGSSAPAIVIDTVTVSCASPVPRTSTAPKPADRPLSEGGRIPGLSKGRRASAGFYAEMERFGENQSGDSGDCFCVVAQILRALAVGFAVLS
jgi:hypothetical protein